MSSLPNENPDLRIDTDTQAQLERYLRLREEAFERALAAKQAAWDKQAEAYQANAMSLQAELNGLREQIQHPPQSQESAVTPLTADEDSVMREGSVVYAVADNLRIAKPSNRRVRSKAPVRASQAGPSIKPRSFIRPRITALPQTTSLPLGNHHTADIDQLPTTDDADADSPARASANGRKQQYRLTAKDYPRGSKEIKDTMNIHIRAVGGWLDTRCPPQDPSDEALQKFASRATNPDSITALQHGLPLIPPSHVKIGTAVYSVTHNSRLVRQARKVEEHMQLYIQSMISRFGFERWCPDFRQSPYSLWNSACRIIALDTFKQALVSHAYAHLQPNLAFVHDMDFLIKLYDHFVHHVHYQHYRSEVLRPGSVKARVERKPAHKGRQRLSQSRSEFLSRHRLPSRYLPLVDMNATSDDERDTGEQCRDGRPIYWIRKRPERSQAAETFIRILDRKMEQEALYDPSRRIAKTRIRLIPDLNQPITEFPKLSRLRLPLDYFDIDFWNQLSYGLKIKVTNFHVAFLPDPSMSLSNDPDERLSTRDFMEKYAEQVEEVYQRYGVDDAMVDAALAADNSMEVDEGDSTTV